MNSRFKIVSKARNGRETVRYADHVIGAWDEHAYFKATAPDNEIEIIDQEAHNVV